MTHPCPICGNAHRGPCERPQDTSPAAFRPPMTDVKEARERLGRLATEWAERGQLWSADDLQCASAAHLQGSADLRAILSALDAAEAESARRGEMLERVAIKLRDIAHGREVEQPDGSTMVEDFPDIGDRVAALHAEITAATEGENTQ